MTIDDKRAGLDIVQAEHENAAEALRVLAIGKTTAGTYVSLLVGTDGSLQ